MATGRQNDAKKRLYMISAVAKRFDVHPQTLRLYEKDGLLKPLRTEGNTRLYSEEDLERLEIILNLTRNLGVNLAGVEIILNMREKMGNMQKEMNAFLEFFLDQLSSAGVMKEDVRQRALARIPPGAIQVLIDRMKEINDRTE